MNITAPELHTQKRVIEFLRSLGYEYLGNWEYRENNSNIETEYLIAFLKKQGYKDEIIKRAIDKLLKIAGNRQKSVYDRNKEVYGLLRYGVDVKPSPTEKTVKVRLVDWKNPQNNHLAIAEEVTVKGYHTKRPDLVIYLNGIAVGIIELKRSSISVSEGIRQNLDNQKNEFIKDFFVTIQFVMAGNDTQGLSYGTIETPERYYLQWKEENPRFDHNKKSDIPRSLPRHKCDKSDNILDCDLYRLLNKSRFLEIIHDFIVFDAGIKKLPRHSQYFAIKAAQKSIKAREGGIIWHTQGSGKSLIMIWLAKWIIENIDDSRVLIITDREELDDQIEKNFKAVGENKIHRTKSARDLISELNTKDNNLICSLVHKFGHTGRSSHYDEYIRAMTQALPENFEAKGNIFVFVDECHRTQSGKLHKAMRRILPNAVFIGFTGTPLLKKDKPTTLETFGKYIHTYKFDEGVEDGVILDLRYEARDVDMKVTSGDKIDTWFEIKTKGLSDLAKAQLKKRWGTLKKLYSSRSRMEKIVADIILDFSRYSRLATGRGNALLVAGSIYEACKFYELFKNQGFDKLAIITSYRPKVASIKGETTGEEGEAENIKKFEVYRKMIADYYNISLAEAESDKWIDKFEKDVKEKFQDEPGQMKLLIVVDKLLTGFDAPSATYLYIDKPMRDHGLFQAICRVNRLDDKDKNDELDKDYGYIIDYRDLFNVMEKTIKDYTQGAFEGFDKQDVEGLLKDRLTDAKKRLDQALEKLQMLTEYVKPPKGINEYRDYFIGDDSEEKQQLRLDFYKAVSSFVRAYTNIANELDEAGYSKKEQAEIKDSVKYYTSLRDELKLMSGDYLDLKIFDPAMRFLIDAYIQSDESQVLASFNDASLLDIVAAEGIEKAIAKLPQAIREDKEAIAETIENNIRKLIIEKHDVNPAYYDKMSQILNDLIEQRRKKVIDYKEYLQRVEELNAQVQGKTSVLSRYPTSVADSIAKQAIYDNLPDGVDKETLTNDIHNAVLRSRKDAWRNNTFKERRILNAIKQVVNDDTLAEDIFDLVKQQNEY